MAGRVSGKLVEVDTIREGAVEEAQEDLILLVRAASGEEEVGAAGRRLKGVILRQSLPHLSHLGAPRPPRSRVLLPAWCCRDPSHLKAICRVFALSQLEPCELSSSRSLHAIFGYQGLALRNTVLMDFFAQSAAAGYCPVIFCVGAQAVAKISVWKALTL